MSVIASLVVQIGADIAELRRNMEKATDIVEKGALSFGKLVSAEVTADAITGTLTTGFNFLVGAVEASVHAASEAEKSHTQLVQALRAQGNATPEVVDAYQQYAIELQRTTVFQDDAVESAAVLLTTIGSVMPRDMKRALQATTDLASVLGGDLNGAAMKVAQAAEGNVKGLKKLVGGFNENRLAAEGFSYVLDRIEEKFGGQGAALAATYEGRLKQLENTWNNVEESIGRAITTNATVLGVMSEVNGAIDSNTDELTKNQAVVSLVSDTVMGLLRVFSGVITVSASLVEGAGYVATGFFGVYNAAINISAVLEKATIAFLKFVQFVTRVNLSGPIQALEQDIDNLKKKYDANVETGGKVYDTSQRMADAMRSASAAASTVADRLEHTRGKTVELSDKLQTNASAFDRHTVAAAKAGEGVKQFQAALADLSSVGDTVQDTLSRVDGTVAEGVRYYIERGVSLETLATVYGLTKEQARGFKEQLDFENKTVDATAKAYGDFHHTLGLIAPRFGELHEQLTGVDDASGNLHATVIGDDEAVFGFANQMAYAEQKAEGLRSALKAFRATGTSVSDFLKSSLGPAIIGAFQGGGDVSKSIGSTIGGFFTSATSTVGKSIASTLTSSLGSTLGGALGSVIPGLGTLVGGAIGGLFGKLFGGNKELKQTNQLRDQFINAAGGISELTRRAQEAGISLTAMLSAKKVDDFKAAVQKVSDALDFQQKSEDTLQQTIDKYGLTLDQLGPKFRQQKLDEGFAQLYQDQRVLTAAGVDFDTVLDKQQQSFQDLVTSALKTGATIPEQLRPAIERLVEMGDLTDAEGNKLTDVSQIPFAESMSTTFQKVGDQIEKLAAAIERAFGGAFDNAADHANAALNRIPRHIDTEVGIHSPGVHAGDIDVPAFATGGIVTSPTLALIGEKGPEAIVPLSGPSSGYPVAAAGGDQTIILQVDGREIARVVNKQNDDNLRTRRRLGAA